MNWRNWNDETEMTKKENVVWKHYCVPVWVFIQENNTDMFDPPERQKMELWYSVTELWLYCVCAKQLCNQGSKFPVFNNILLELELSVGQ